MADDLIELELTGAEAKLVLKYGYPFSEIEPIFESIAGKRGWHCIQVDRYWQEMLAGDLARSIRESNSEALIHKLDTICTTIEIAVGSLNKSSV